MTSGASKDGIPLVKYEEFRSQLVENLIEAGLSPIGGADETLSPRSVDRQFEGHYAQHGEFAGAGRKPLFVTATVSFRWNALLAARFETTEEDFAMQVFGDFDAVDRVVMEEPSLRLDTTLTASLNFDKSAPMPDARRLRSFTKEALGRLESTERLLPKSTSDIDERGNLIVLSWQGEPQVEARLTPAGELRLHAVKISAFEIIPLPRHFDDHERDVDEPVEGRLKSLASRIHAALTAWGQATDHLGLGGPE